MINTKSIKPIEILMIEDEWRDIHLMEAALKNARVVNNISTANDGLEAMHLLKRKGAYANAQTPDLILLDLNLPKKNGHEVLKEIKQDPRLKQIPVVVVSSSEKKNDIGQAFDLRADCYISKPVDLNRFVAIVKSIENFSLAFVKHPVREI
jgi:chemotaxis family two-component system response regulator Rcp1